MTYGRLAQLVEHLLDVQEVTGSSPVPSTTSPDHSVWGFFCGGRYRTRTARAERSEGNQSPGGALISARFPTRRNVYRDAGTVWGFFCGGRYGTRTKMNKGRVSPWRWYPAFLCSQPELCFSPTFHDCPQRSLLDRPQKPYSNREGHCFGCGNSQPYASQTKFHRQNDQKQKQQCKRAKKCDQS